MSAEKRQAKIREITIIIIVDTGAVPTAITTPTITGIIAGGGTGLGGMVAGIIMRRVFPD